MTTPPPPPELALHYDTMWDRAFAAVAAGDIDCDTRLAAGPDPRRGLTVIARPGPEACARFDTLLDRLSALEPGQYRQPPPDMHMTVLSLFTVAGDATPALARLADYRAAVRAAVAGVEAFEVAFAGIALSRGAVLARGFPQGPQPELLRARLRAQLRKRGLDALLDERYRLVTAHATLLRFVRPLRDPARFSEELALLRDAPLGTMRVDRLELVVNDWTMSSASLERVDTLPLS
ncbi:2'-5' RNA ligase family protein [Massilia sp. YIM B02763]|uniref:2'-5' RNA ligase family protein n=1 Tax=Massilia sp. YIM B02763 TaxID=3050130 RepID=UPI0025B64E9A|nr:2'-5' RNA ligase family protein [Massilia sp. YIM B02763]MDN4052109.1 2'-5' RNA ligase family protein [Massilia sp. YIM B02763]